MEKNPDVNIISQATDTHQTVAPHSIRFLMLGDALDLFCNF
ncbi:hypothetical protein [Bacillus vallismortis]|nr:hypothetical protein [Bacillus vallismortis]